MDAVLSLRSHVVIGDAREIARAQPECLTGFHSQVVELAVQQAVGDGHDFVQALMIAIRGRVSRLSKGRA